jgi:hypothetical protein
MDNLSDTFNEERSELLYGTENAVQRGVQFMQKVKKGMGLFGDKNGPSIVMEFDIYRDNYKAVKRRGARIRLITEITRDNIHYCKELIRLRLVTIFILFLAPNSQSRLSFDFKYFITTIIVIALKFPSFLWPIRNNPTAIGNRIMP